MKKNIILVLILVNIFSVVTAGTGRDKKNKPQAPENIILMIGDGMGTAQVYAGYTALKGTMNITGMPVSGFSVTYSADDYITDSGAGGTALATGVKTRNGSIGVDESGQPVESILEKAEKKGLSTALISTSAITHATPASFIAHTSDRSRYADIAFDFLRTDIDVFIGGGYNHFARRADSLNLIDSLKARNYVVVRKLDDVNVKSVTRLAALLADEHLPSMAKGRGNMLPDATVTALKILKRNDQGFFMMVEGSQIDWGGHANDFNYVLGEVVDFDNAVGKALKFAKEDGETLVIVTADHETGGLGLVGGSVANGAVQGNFILKDHTAVMVPVFAFGPGAEMFTGVQDNTDIFKKCVKLLGLK